MSLCGYFPFMRPGPGQRHARLTKSPTFNPLLAMTPGQALEQIAYICIDKLEDGGSPLRMFVVIALNTTQARSDGQV